MSIPEPGPWSDELGPTPESVEKGAEPADALYSDRGWPPDAPEPPDPLDVGYAALQVWRAEQALDAAREPEPDDPEPEMEAG